MNDDLLSKIMAQDSVGGLAPPANEVEPKPKRKVKKKAKEEEKVTYRVNGHIFWPPIDPAETVGEAQWMKDLAPRKNSGSKGKQGGGKGKSPPSR